LRQYNNPDLNIQLETLESIAQQDFQTLSEEKALKNVNLLYPFINIIIFYKIVKFKNYMYYALIDFYLF